MGNSAPDSDSSTQSELCNRIETVVHSPRRLPDMENSYWKSVDPRTVASMNQNRNSLLFNPDDPRSLSQEYEYDLYVKQKEQEHETKRKLKSKKSFKELARKVIDNGKDERNLSSTKKSKKKKKKGHKKKVRDVEAPDVTYRVSLNDPNRERIFWLSPSDVPQSTV